MSSIVGSMEHGVVAVAKGPSYIIRRFLHAPNKKQKWGIDSAATSVQVSRRQQGDLASKASVVFSASLTADLRTVQINVKGLRSLTDFSKI